MLYAHLQPDLGELLYVWGCFPRLGGENDNTTLAKHLIECARSWSLQSDTKSQELPGFGPSGHNLATSKAYSKILRDSEERGSNGALNYISPSILCISNGKYEKVDYIASMLLRHVLGQMPTGSQAFFRG